MPVLGKIDFSGWLSYNQVISRILTSLPNVKQTWLINVVARYREEVLDQMLKQGIRATGTYEQSFEIITEFGGKEPQAALALVPSGENARRLSIYWKTLEFGAQPNPLVPVSSIARWADTKLGADFIGAGKITMGIRERGILPHPVLSRIFLLSNPDGAITGLTPLAESIAEEEAVRVFSMMRQIFFTTSSTGQVVARNIAGSPGGIGGRFTFSK